MMFHELIDTAFRLKDECVWVENRGDVDGEPMLVVIAVGPAVPRLAAILKANSNIDPRSTAEER